ncbi:tyrosine 3-monooxygenase/tryptophan 5-monooxygenase activation protein [Clonorchis sinensis]|uniref:Tyrosine 3-monooxygenase/tryptophan 5-monooxygenase activation protein n=1 Tax=Clonorchis sinensis TaxID=79923 RepID=G7Y3U1_CLOSI|nr:tyrosine 3-monooxygenase/tryptophan 5-monooxygenase activation protein [Clonorchis sinensis]
MGQIGGSISGRNRKNNWAFARSWHQNMVDYMEWLIKSHPTIVVEEQNLLASAYKHVLDPLRSSFKLLKVELQKAEEQNSPYSGLFQTFAQQVGDEIRTIATRALRNVDMDMSKEHKCEESRIISLKLYYSRTGDFFRYLAEIGKDDDRVRNSEHSQIAYKQARSLASKHLPQAHPLQLGIMLNTATLYHTILDKKNVALDMISTALEFAKTDLDQVSRVNAKETTHLVKVLMAYKIKLEEEIKGEVSEKHKAMVNPKVARGILKVRNARITSDILFEILSEDNYSQRIQEYRPHNPGPLSSLQTIFRYLDS